MYVIPFSAVARLQREGDSQEVVSCQEKSESVTKHTFIVGNQNSIVIKHTSTIAKQPSTMTERTCSLKLAAPREPHISFCIQRLIVEVE